jgi:hypothetical protein
MMQARNSEVESQRPDDRPFSVRHGGIVLVYYIVGHWSVRGHFLLDQLLLSSMLSCAAER